ncbi:MAG: alpha/beta hydrolase [Lentisphaeria bacterium]|nr:alpha/beta hydrolase [Lentisphaeria bacterium]
MSGKISMAALWKRIYFRIPVYIITGCMVLYASGVLAMDKILFPNGNSETYRYPKSGNITLSSGSEKLDAFFHRGRAGMPVILYSHGNGEILAWVKPLLERFIARGYGVMAYDYAGYGNSTGVPGEVQAYKDIDAAYRYLVDKENIQPGDIVVMGFSVGSGPSCYLAAREKVKALVIVSGFASAAQVVLPFSVPFDKFPNAERLKKCRVPLLIFHGKNDKVVPIRNGEKLFESSAAPVRKFYREDAGHNDIFQRTTNFFRKFEDFLNETVKRNP